MYTDHEKAAGFSTILKKIFQIEPKKHVIGKCFCMAMLKAIRAKWLDLN